MQHTSNNSSETKSGLAKTFEYAAMVAYALAGESPALGLFTAGYLSQKIEAGKTKPQL